MEGPGEEELQWMAMQEADLAEEEYYFREEAFEHPLPPSDDGPAAIGAADELDKLDGLEGLEALPGKRKRLVFPDMEIPSRKSSRLEDAGREAVPENVPAAGDTVMNEKLASFVDDSEDLQSNLPCKRAADISGDYISITGPCGQRVYAEVKEELAIGSFFSSADQVQLLHEPIDKIMERIEREEFEQICSKFSSDDQGNDACAPVSVGQLWVDKYAPKSFTELLSNEQINREVLSWLKEWDPCVFGVKSKSAVKKPLPAVKHFKDKRMGSSRHELPAKQSEQEKDRPGQKVLLLCGAPGLGKTTLAHVAARHCGYRVVEINASDDRTTATFQGKVLDAIQMKPVMGDQRPNCLVIDEIDGALNGAEGKSAISFLINLTSESVDAGGESTEAKSKKRTRISRPVICICNDLYAPALRPLRHVARVHMFAAPSTQRIVTRLSFICDSEGYKVSLRALTALAVHTECDIRSCLNTLQFLHRKGKILHELDVASQVIGKKDMTSSMFDIWREIFHVRKRRVDPLAGSKQEQRDFKRLHDLFENHGEYDLAIEGIHENLLTSRFQDANSLQKTIYALDLILEADIFAYRTISRQQFFLNSYRPAFNIAIRRLVVQPTRPTLEWPKSYQRLRHQLAVKTEILDSWMTSIAPGVLQSVSFASLVLDLVSPFLSILAPALRPVAFHLMTPQEFELMKELVDTMIMYAVSYKQSKPVSPDSKPDAFASLSIHPPLHSLITFKDYAHRHPQLPLTMRQILNKEIELQTIKRGGRPDESKSLKFSQKISTKKPSEIASEGPKQQPKPIKQSSNYFDRFRKTSTSSGTQSTNANKTVKRDSHPILFKFQEGFTNAIKRPVLMREL